MYQLRNKRFLVRIHKAISKHHPELPGKRDFNRFLESINFSAEKLLETYPIPERDQGIVDRTLRYMQRKSPISQHRRREINGLELSEYEKAILNAIDKGAEFTELMSTLGYLIPEDFINSVSNADLKELLQEMQ